eukprot:TRINITY_DN359_c0_g1_i1.p1 TRINITY_DN359_c0_g1~~TRINITY_DN359_c0_g1_i1.p1  ORF type:complete len:401 (+),score=107.75 TRINITY_DN359_c0_g1_i1:30-1205(+)
MTRTPRHRSHRRWESSNLFVVITLLMLIWGLIGLNKNDSFEVNKENSSDLKVKELETKSKLNVDSKKFECPKCPECKTCLPSEVCPPEKECKDFEEEINSKDFDSKVLVVLAYYKSRNTNYDIERNFRYFQKEGIKCNNSHVDFIIIENSDVNSIPLTNVNPNRCNNVFYFERKNENYDFGAYAEVLERFENEHIEKKLKEVYKYFFFMNGSVRGPFLSPLLSNTVKASWWKLFIKLFNANVAIVGPTLNCHPILGCHIQSGMFVLNNMGFDEVFPLWKSTSANMKEAQMLEVKTSQHLLKKGYNMNTLMPTYVDIDWQKHYKHVRELARSNIVALESPYFPNFFPHPINAHDVVFIKVNKPNIDKKEVELLTRASLHDNTMYSMYTYRQV